MSHGKDKSLAEMEPPARVKAISDKEAQLVVNPSVKATQYVRSGKEMLRSAANYNEDHSPEHAYTLYMRFLTIFLDKIKHHPGYKEIPPAEKKLMNSYCKEVLPKAEELKAVLLKKYEKEYEEYVVHLEECAKKASEAQQREKRKTDPRESTLGYDPNQSLPWKWESTLPAAPSAPFLPSPTSLAMAGGTGGNISGISYSNIMNEVNGVSYDKGESPSGSLVQPQFDRTTKPGRFISPMSSGLRQIVIPGDLSAVFLELAERNTLKNVETCGFLTGKISGGKLVITDLIIPKQTGTSDSCTTSHEEEYSIVQDKFDLITFGWIHTHPSQTAFLSSIDMHTHYWYQFQMPEAIAIVCAPSKADVGIFVLDTGGMEVIGNCREAGFHPHPITTTPLFVEASHYTFDESKSVRVHDLRK